jgi:hypothetical protein
MAEKTEATESLSEEAAAANGQVTQSEEKQGRSTIAFPYGDLDDAVEIAKALHEHWGGKGTADQLGASMNTSMKSGAFRLKLATAKTFGVIKSENQQIELTQLGKQIVDSGQEELARIKAFLAVPLYKAIYVENKSDRLPPIKGLESQMIGLGVIPKQVDKARQAFQRSAKQAGFFKQGEDRLVLPVNPALLEGGADAAPPKPRRRPRGGPQQAQTGALHPDVDRLMATFLREGHEWPAEKQQGWLEAVRSLDRLTQEEADDGKTEASP